MRPVRRNGRDGFMKKKDTNTIKMNEQQKKQLEVPLKWFLILHVSLIINSLAGVASKKAGQSDFLSVRWCLYYGLVLLVTFLFALVWQQVLKHMSLTFAFTNKPVTIIYSLIWAVAFFHEELNVWKVIGSLIILAGIVVGVSEND